MRRLLALAVALAAFAVTAPAAGADAGRISVGLAPDAVAADVGAAVAAATGGTVATELGALDALLVDVPDVSAAVAAAAVVPGVEYAEPVEATRSILFQPNDPLAQRQWYLPFVRAFDAWTEQPPLAPVRVAVIDSGIDLGHPEFAGRVVARRSFVSTPAGTDTFGHGTMVAGEIAASLNNSQGIAGLGISVELLVAKVVGPSGNISLEAEARAIRWAADRGADVINLSLGGPRDPLNPDRDTYSELEQSAVDYAVRRGALVVAAVGNCMDICPDPYANYPAALPHVVGVSAVDQSGATPDFSNRDRLYNDLAAPGTDIVSTYPRRLSSSCAEQGYNTCAKSARYRRAMGTSFSTPLVVAAAALVIAESESRPLGIRPHASQVAAVLARSAADTAPVGRDRLSGSGVLDVAAAIGSLSDPLPPRDRYEANDDAGARSYPLGGLFREVQATVDRYDDARDVYRIRLRAGQRGVFTLTGPDGTNTNLALWKPGTKRIAGAPTRSLARASRSPGATERISYRARRSGLYYLEVKLAKGRGGPYRLVVRKS